MTITQGMFQLHELEGHTKRLLDLGIEGDDQPKDNIILEKNSVIYVKTDNYRYLPIYPGESIFLSLFKKGIAAPSSSIKVTFKELVDKSYPVENDHPEFETPPYYVEEE